MSIFCSSQPETCMVAYTPKPRQIMDLISISEHIAVFMFMSFVLISMFFANVFLLGYRRIRQRGKKEKMRATQHLAPRPTNRHHDDVTHLGSSRESRQDRDALTAFVDVLVWVRGSRFMYVHTYVCKSVCTYLCVCIFTYVYMYVCTYLCIYVSMSPVVGLCTYLRMYASMYVRTFVYMSPCLQSEGVTQTQSTAVHGCAALFSSFHLSNDTIPFVHMPRTVG